MQGCPHPCLPREILDRDAQRADGAWARARLHNRPRFLAQPTDVQDTAGFVSREVRGNPASARQSKAKVGVISDGRRTWAVAFVGHSDVEVAALTGGNVSRNWINEIRAIAGHREHHYPSYRIGSVHARRPTQLAGDSAHIGEIDPKQDVAQSNATPPLGGP